MTPVMNSSSIAGYEYDAATEKLTVEFIKTKTTYDYFDIPEVVFREFESAESKGRYFYAYVRGRYRTVKREPVAETAP